MSVSKYNLYNNPIYSLKQAWIACLHADLIDVYYVPAMVIIYIKFSK